MQTTDVKTLVKAVSSIPHIGAVLAATITIGICIYEQVKNLEPRFAAEKKLGKEADYTIRSIAKHSQNLRASDPEHLQKLEEHIQELKEIAEKIRMHILETACARERHIRRFGPTLSNVYDCVVETSSVFSLQSKLSEAKRKLMDEFQWIRMMEGYSNMPPPPPYDLIAKEEEHDEKDTAMSGPVRWMKAQEVAASPDLHAKMVPLCRPKDSEDGTSWYIARVHHYGGLQPGKYKPGYGAFYGHRREALFANDQNVEVLIAEPGSVDWVPASGKFTEEQSDRIDAVEGCRENDGTQLAIVRAWAREHMKVFAEKTVQPGKASPKLDCAYVIAGREERKAKNYDVLVYANQFFDEKVASDGWMMVNENRTSDIGALLV